MVVHACLVVYPVLVKNFAPLFIGLRYSTNKSSMFSSRPNIVFFLLLAVRTRAFTVCFLAIQGSTSVFVFIINLFLFYLFIYFCSCISVVSQYHVSAESSSLFIKIFIHRLCLFYSLITQDLFKSSRRTVLAGGSGIG